MDLIFIQIIFQESLSTEEEMIMEMNDFYLILENSNMNLAYFAIIPILDISLTALTASKHLDNLLLELKANSLESCASKILSLNYKLIKRNDWKNIYSKQF